MYYQISFSDKNRVMEKLFEERSFYGSVMESVFNSLSKLIWKKLKKNFFEPIFLLEKSPTSCQINVLNKGMIPIKIPMKNMCLPSSFW